MLNVLSYYTICAVAVSILFQIFGIGMVMIDGDLNVWPVAMLTSRGRVIDVIVGVEGCTIDDSH